jgi:hypothetical protein
MATKTDTSEDLRALAQAAREQVWADETAALLAAMTSGNWDLARTRYEAGEHLRSEAERQLVRAATDVLEALDQLARTTARTREQITLHGPALMLNSLGVIQSQGARVDAAVGRHSACLEMLKAVIFIKDGRPASEA